ncbi:MAG: MAPEG family protein [Pseudomonadota bacterium]
MTSDAVVNNPLIYAMIAHIGIVIFLYIALTIVRAPSVWGIGLRPDGANPLLRYESRVSANLSNQFEWPVLFYVGCLLALGADAPAPSSAVTLAWIFVVGRVIHSVVQIGSANVRLRGVVFTVNFLAVIGLWAVLLLGSL